MLVNLAGELVDRRPTPANIALLTGSRVEPTHALVEATRATPPRVWVQLSTTAIYGDAGDAVLDERSAPAAGPPQMAGVALAWEAAAAMGTAGRQVILRTAVVLDRDSPALDRLVSLARWGLGGRVGTGRQWVSWLHIEDFVGIVRHVIDDETLSGVVHACSPQPVRNTELMRELRAATHRPSAPSTPASLVRAGALLLRTDPALALTGRRAVPARLQATGYRFAQPELGGALRSLLDR